MDGYINGLPLILHAGQAGEQNQMSGGRYGKEFGYALNQGHKDQLKQWHNISIRDGAAKVKQLCRLYKAIVFMGKSVFESESDLK